MSGPEKIRKARRLCRELTHLNPLNRCPRHAKPDEPLNWEAERRMHGGPAMIYVHHTTTRLHNCGCTVVSVTTFTNWDDTISWLEQKIAESIL